MPCEKTTSGTDPTEGLAAGRYSFAGTWRWRWLSNQSKLCTVNSEVRILLTVTACSGDRDRFAAVWRCAVKL